jgi:hypothetical protein
MFFWKPWMRIIVYTLGLWETSVSEQPERDFFEGLPFEKTTAKKLREPLAKPGWFCQRLLYP